MRIVSVELSESDLESLEKLIPCRGVYRPESIRLAIRDLIREELLLGRELGRELERKPVKDDGFRLLNFCINCERELYNIVRKNYRNFEVFQLKFCCSCYDQFKDKSFDEFPSYLIKRIKKRVREYKKFVKDSNRSD